MKNDQVSSEFSEFRRDVIKKYPQLESGLIRIDDCDPETQNAALRAYRFANKRVKAGLASRENQIDAFARVSFDFMRLQARFMLTGKYAATGNPEYLHELYQDDAKMEGYYLDGLLLTYVLWPNHAKFFSLFLNSFVPKFSNQLGINFGEIGVGHGLMASTIIEEHNSIRYTALDISGSSLKFTRQSFELLNSGDNLICKKIDATKSELPAELLEHFDAFICCEVLEHVRNPEKMLENIKRMMKPGATLLVTTVCNMEAEDHIYLFNNVDEVQQMISKAGFKIVSQVSVGLEGYPSVGPVPMNYFAIVVA